METIDVNQIGNPHIYYRHLTLMDLIKYANHEIVLLD